MTLAYRRTGAKRNGRAQARKLMHLLHTGCSKLAAGAPVRSARSRSGRDHATTQTKASRYSTPGAVPHTLSWLQILLTS